MGIYERVDRQHVTAPKREEGWPAAYKRTNTQAKYDEKISNYVDILIDEEAILWPLYLPLPGKVTIKRAAEPVHKQAANGEPKIVQRKIRAGKPNKSRNRPRKAQAREAVGRDPMGRSRSQPIKRPQLKRTQGALIKALDAGQSSSRGKA